MAFLVLYQDLNIDRSFEKMAGKYTPTAKEKKIKSTFWFPLNQVTFYSLIWLLIKFVCEQKSRPIYFLTDFILPSLLLLFLWLERIMPTNWTRWKYRAFHRFGQAKFPDGVSVLGSRQFSILPQLSLKTMLGLKVVKIDSKISN